MTGRDGEPRLAGAAETNGEEAVSGMPRPDCHMTIVADDAVSSDACACITRCLLHVARVHGCCNAPGGGQKSNSGNVSGHKQIQTEIALRQIGTVRLPDRKRTCRHRGVSGGWGRRLVHRHNAGITPKLRAAARSAPEAPLLQPPPRRAFPQWFPELRTRPRRRVQRPPSPRFSRASSGIKQTR